MKPYNKEIIYKDPTTNEFTYVNPPGLDMGNLKAVGTQLFPEILGGLTGAASTMNPQRRVTGPITGGIGGYAAATGAAELAGVGDITKGVMQGAGTVAGALSGTGQAAVTPIVLGETVGGFLTRYQTLKDLKNKGLLNETYDEEKLYKTALKDAGVTFLFGVGANALGTAIIKASSKGGYGIEGFDYDAFESAFDDLKAAAAGDPAAERVIATATVPEIMEAGNVGSPITREAFQSNILDAASGGGDQAKLVKARLDEARRAREEGLDTQIGIADPSMPTKTGTVKEELKGLEGSEKVLRREQMGKEILEIEKQIENTRGNFGDQLNLLGDPDIEPEYVINYIRETLDEVRKAAGKTKGDKTMDPYGSFKVKLNKMVADSKNNDKVLDNILDLSNTGNRPFFQELLDDGQFPEARVYLKKALLNKYKTAMGRDEAGNLIPLTSKKHDDFINTNKNVIDDLLNKEELSTLGDARLWGDQLKRKENSYDKAINKLRQEPWGRSTDPEFIFRNTWTAEKEGITKTRKVKELIEENQELADEYRLNILKDMKDQTGSFKGKQLVDYVDNYGAMLDEWFPSDFSKNINPRMTYTPYKEGDPFFRLGKPFK